MALKFNSKTYLRGAIFWYRPSFIKKMQNFVLREKSLFAKVLFSQKWTKFLGKIFFQPLDIGFRCFVPKNHENWLYSLGAMAKKPSKTWFFMFFDFLAFLTHPNDQKRFWRARYYFFHVWTPLKKFRQNLGTPSTKVFGPVWIQSCDIINTLVMNIQLVSAYWNL